MWKASSKVVDMNVFEPQLTCGIQFFGVPSSPRCKPGSSYRKKGLAGSDS